MRPNRLRELLDAGKPSYSTHVLISWPAIVELVGQTGQYDYVEFVAEYAPYDLYALENIGRAIDLFDNFSGMMKIEQEPRTYLTVRAIGSGIQNLLFADVRTPEEARECVQAVRASTPSTGGRHGAGSRRDTGYVREGGSQAFVDALEQAVVMLMIEKDEAVRNLENVIGVGGVDMVQFGPTDYAMSIDKPGQGGSPLRSAKPRPTSSRPRWAWAFSRAPRSARPITPSATSTWASPTSRSAPTSASCPAGGPRTAKPSAPRWTGPKRSLLQARTSRR